MHVCLVGEEKSPPVPAFGIVSNLATAAYATVTFYTPITYNGILFVRRDLLNRLVNSDLVSFPRCDNYGIRKIVYSNQGRNKSCCMEA